MMVINNVKVAIVVLFDKVQLFWEGHKKLCNVPHGLDIYLVIAQTMRKIVQIFVTLSEKLNFITVHNNGYLHIVDHHHALW